MPETVDHPGHARRNIVVAGMEGARRTGLLRYDHTRNARRIRGTRTTSGGMTHISTVS